MILAYILNPILFQNHVPFDLDLTVQVTDFVIVLLTAPNSFSVRLSQLDSVMEKNLCTVYYGGAKKTTTRWLSIN